MWTDAPSGSETVLPTEFYLQVKQVLENFYDFPYLNHHPLAKALPLPRSRATETDGQRLRRVFLAAIDELKPGSSAPQKTLQARYHSLINLRYVESDTMQQVARELGISERQAYRDLKRAEESLANLLWESVGRSLTRVLPQPEEAAPEMIEEMIDLQPRPVNALDLLRNAGHAVERLAQQQGTLVEFALPEVAPALYTDPRLARQVFVNLLSYILQNTAPTRLQVSLDDSTGQVVMNFEFQATQPVPGDFHKENPVASQLIHQLGWQLVEQAGTIPGGHCVRLIAGDEEAVILVIDDHPPLIELLRRFLTHTRCQVIGVSDGLAGLQLARTLSPDVILLDVMMPEIDGWEVLQRLRNAPETAQTPVVICSIFNDPRLAFSLGATALLTKPVNREKLLEVLKNLKIIG